MNKKNNRLSLMKDEVLELASKLEQCRYITVD